MPGAGMKIVFVWVLTCLLWSTVWLFIKLGVRDIPPISFAGIRLVLAITTLLPVLSILRIPLPRAARDLRLIADGVLLRRKLRAVFWAPAPLVRSDGRSRRPHQYLPPLPATTCRTTPDVLEGVRP
jgi:O-antigen ligase